MILFGLTLGLFELIFLPIALLLLILGASLDRRGESNAMKWLVLLIGGAIAGIVYQDHWSLRDLLSPAVFIGVAIYAGAGVAYSFVEFLLEVRRTAVRLSESWQSFLTRPTSSSISSSISKTLGELKDNKALLVRDVLALAQDAEPGSEAWLAARDIVGNFATNERIRGSSSFILVRVVEEGIMVEPKIDRGELSQHVGAWVTLWPAYLLSTLLDDLLRELFNALAALINRVGGRLVKAIFADVFKV